jgi:hypothetical protein
MSSPLLHRLLVQAKLDDLRRSAAASARSSRPRPSGQRARVESSLTLRFGFPDDAQALARLAALDSAQSPAGPVLLAEVNGQLRAALSLSDGAVVADPFYASAAVVELLRARADQLEDAAAGHRSGWLRPWSRFRLATWR